MKDLPVDPKQKAILESAWQAFATYGFRKTSMDDIARGAGMSRPAVYLHYKNKEAIFRSLVQFYYDTAVANVSAALAEPGSVSDRIARAFDAQGGELMAAMLTSPHGMELVDAGSLTAAEVVAEGEERLRALYSAWLEGEVSDGRLRLTGAADDVAATMTAALKGIKTTVPDFESYTTRVKQLAALIGAGLEVR